ncbi:MAG: lipopolysaccharide kinase InaA family protein [Candidatus Scalindua sp.]|nr:lipopolysaccharide kinase InaA family protein [Candidatus Scalindua sp.]MCR4343228.1 lipopolysaccharide kinase InaA family protein [Candidatus Scalindua sp.]
MKNVELPAYFSTLNKGKVTLHIKKEYENRMSDQDIDGLFNLCKEPSPGSNHADKNELNNSYQGRSTCKTLSVDSLGNDSFIVREYWHGGMVGKIFRDFFWGGMRPVRELSVCEAANRGGIKSTEIIAIVKNKILGPLYKFRLITREITESIDLIELLLHSGENQLFDQKKQIINELAKAVNDMHNVGIYHADLHLKNILVKSDSGGGVNVYIIDLDKSKQYEKIRFQRRMRNIMRLDRSVVKMRRKNRELFSKTFPVSKTDRIRFLKKYIEMDSESVKPLRYYIKSYNAYAFHKLWWSMGGG